MQLYDVYTCFQYHCGFKVNTGNDTVDHVAVFWINITPKLIDTKQTMLYDLIQSLL